MCVLETIWETEGKQLYNQGYVKMKNTLEI